MTGTAAVDIAMAAAAMKTSKPAITCPATACGYIFTNINKLVLHIETEHKEDAGRTKYKCIDCGFRAVLAWSLQKHIYRVHTNDAHKMKAKMAAAGASFDKCEMSRYVDSIDKIEADNPSTYLAECPHCCRTFCATSQLRTHVENVHRPGSTSWGCVDCGYAYTTVHFLKVHIEGAHTRDPMMVQSKLEQRKEIIAPGTSEPPSLECDVCGKKYSTTESLKGHKRQTHRPKDQYFKCDIDTCGQMYNRRSALDRHKRNAHKPGAPQIPCDQCGAIFASSQALSIHIRSRHEEDSLVRRKDTDPRNKKQHNTGDGHERRKRARPAAVHALKQEALMQQEPAGSQHTLTPLSTTSSPMLQVQQQPPPQPPQAQPQQQQQQQQQQQGQQQPGNMVNINAALLQPHNLMNNAQQIITGHLQTATLNAPTIGIGDLYHSISRAASSYAWMDNMGQINARQGRLIAIFMCPQCHKQFADVNDLLQHQVVEHALC